MSKILIIDDDPEICRVVSTGLGMQGYEVTAATNGTDGLLAAAATTPDLILCDLDMPGLDGQQVVTALREDKRLGEIPVIFLSACAERGQIRRSMDLGGDDYITKPAPWPEIVAAIKARLARRQKQIQKMDRQVNKAAEVFVGIIHDLNNASPEVRWLTDAAGGLANQQNRIIQKVHQTLSEDESSGNKSSASARPVSLLVKDNHRQKLLKLSEVKAVLACGEYSDIHWGNDQHMMFRKPLKQWAKELPPNQFLRVHRQAIVNLAFLDYVEKDSAGKLQIHLREFKQIIPVSQRETAAFKRCLKQFQVR